MKLLGGYVGQRAKYRGVKQPAGGRFTVGPASRTLSSWKRSGRKVCEQGSSSISTSLKMQLDCQQKPQGTGKGRGKQGQIGLERSAS